MSQDFIIILIGGISLGHAFTYVWMKENFRRECRRLKDEYYESLDRMAKSYEVAVFEVTTRPGGDLSKGTWFRTEMEILKREWRNV